MIARPIGPYAPCAEPFPGNCPNTTQTVTMTPMSSPQQRQQARHIAARVSLVVSILLMIGKLLAFSITGSSALLADAAESVVHVVATVFVAFSVWYAAQPADERHPYGHGRIVYLSVGAEGMLVLTASVAVFFSGYHSLVHGPNLHRLGTGFGIAALVGIINLALALYIHRIGVRHDSVALIANSKHIMSDVLTTLAAGIGIGLVLITGRDWLDPVTAFVIGGMILVNGISLVRRSIAGLMDELDPELAARVVTSLDAAIQQGTIVGYHRLRCRALNDEIWIDAHIQVPDHLTIVQAHDRATQIESTIRNLFAPKPVEVTTHVEPADHESAHPTGHEPPDDALPSHKPGPRQPS